MRFALSARTNAYNEMRLEWGFNLSLHILLPITRASATDERVGADHRCIELIFRVLEENST